MSFIVIFLSSLILSLVLTPIVREVMLRLGVLSMPSQQRWHNRPIALMGGISIFVSFMLATFWGLEVRGELLMVLLGGGAVFALGVVDDLWGTHHRKKFALIKFAAQVSIAIGVVYLGVVSKILPYSWLDISLTVFWIVGLTNALNLLDNMDGLSSGITIVAAVAILSMALQKGEASVSLLCLALTGSCLGFLVYNFNPARIFMGDCGSLFLGYMLATLTVLGGWQSSSPFLGTLLSPVLVLAVPIFDTTLVTVLRLIHGKMPWHGGRDHSSHRLVSILGGKERNAVLILYSVGILAGGSGLIIMEINSVFAILTTAAFILAMVVFGIRLARVECY